MSTFPGHLKPTNTQHVEQNGLDFDAGLNSSAAWTRAEHLDLGHGESQNENENKNKKENDISSLSLSDESSDMIPDASANPNTRSGSGVALGRPARVLYDFPGDINAQELRLRAGQDIEVLREHMSGAEGWSLARVLADSAGHGGELGPEGRDGVMVEFEDGEVGLVGLIPREYYTFTTDFRVISSRTSSSSQEEEIDRRHQQPKDIDIDIDTDTAAVTPRPSKPPLVPQSTGEWFKHQMRQMSSSLLAGGKSLSLSTFGLGLGLGFGFGFGFGFGPSRARFVSSGTEAFILYGASTPKSKSKPKSILSTPNDTPDSGGWDGLPLSTSTTRFSSSPSSSSSSPSLGHTHTREPTAAPAQRASDVHYYIDADEHGPAWRERVPAFEVRVHSPVKRYPNDNDDDQRQGKGREGKEGSAYIVYSVTSFFSPPPPLPPPPPPADNPEPEPDSDSDSKSKSTTTNTSPRLPLHAYTRTVARRFTHFLLLQRRLSSILPTLALPPLPPKHFPGRLNVEFVEARRRELERWLRLIVSHPVVRCLDEVRFFLGCEDEVEFRRQLPSILTPPSCSLSSCIHPGRKFYANVYHPPFQIDLSPSPSSASLSSSSTPSSSPPSSTEDLTTRFQNHLRAVSTGVQHLRATYAKVREARTGMRDAERMLGMEVLALITSRRAFTREGEEEEDAEEEGEGEEGEAQGRKAERRRSKKRGSENRTKGMSNADGAWCWREDCSDCLRLTKYIQKMGETLQGVADLYDTHARRTMFEMEDSLKDVAHPDSIYAPVLDIHNQALERYKYASEHPDPGPGPGPSPDMNAGASHTNGVSGTKTQSNDENEGDEEEDEEDTIATRCETVLNATLAEFDAYHAQKVERFEGLVTKHLDSEIAFYEKVLTRLRTTRALFSAPASEVELLMPGARQASIYERDLSSSLAVAEPLPHPAPHPLDGYGSGPLAAGGIGRPVSEAIQGLFGSNGVDGSGVARRGGDAAKASAAAEGEGRGGSVFSRLW